MDCVLGRADLRVVVRLAAVLLVVQLLRVLTGMALGLLTVNEVETLGLAQLVDLGACKTSKHLLGKGMVDSLALGTLVLLKLVHGGEASTGAEKFVAQAALVVEVVVVDLVAGIARLVWGRGKR